MTVCEVAEFLKLHRETVNRMIRSGELPALKVGRAWRLSRVQIKEWAKTRCARMQAGKIKVQPKSPNQTTDRRHL